MKLTNLRLSWRLGMAFGLVLLLVLLMAGVGVLQLGRIDSLNDLQTAASDRASAATDWRGETTLNLSRGMVLAKGGNSSTLRDLLAEPMKAGSGRISALVDKLDKAITAPEERALLQTALEHRKSYSALREGLFKRLKQGDVAGVEEDADKLLAPAGKAYIDAVDALNAHFKSSLDAMVAEQNTASHSARLLMLVLAVAAVAAGSLLSWVITRSIVLPLQDAMAATARVAEGDLSHTIQSARGDEVGDLLRSLGAMQQSLRVLVGEVNLSSDGIGTASQEIASGNADLSTRTERTASSLQETASSVEQLTATVRQSADAARMANELAASAAAVANRGGQAVDTVVETMNQINASSRRIADIVGTIDGIAFQTNILALNAAVEAARAGEQGRGFAVVASEVRSLAQRSADAAREIKSLIGASVDRVEAGSKQVTDAGSTMKEIVSSVQRVSDMIGEISTAAAEQRHGIEQVHDAVGELDRMTQQNAALVEQSSAAAESLKDQASRLGTLVGTFRLQAR
jgi:methyl-accepting chemotaxis protein